MLNKVHHIAVFVSDYERSYDFYVNKLGFTVEQEAYRPIQKDTLRMLRCGDVVLELFDRPAGKAATDPDTLGARHIAFHVESVEKASDYITRTIRRTVELDIPTTDGICIEEYLTDLA